jgi:hypothetical protein
MKAFILLSLVFSFWFGGVGRAVKPDDILLAIQSGDASRISNFFDSRVDISLPDGLSSFSKAQAHMVMKNFFSKNGGVKSFELKSRSIQKNQQSIVGILQTNKSRYRATFFMVGVGGDIILKEIRFQPE